MDLLSWEAPELAPSHDEARIRSANLSDRIARAVAETLRQCGLDREEVAEQMTAFLGRPVSKAMLDQYSSQAVAEKEITLSRAVGLAKITGDDRHLQAAIEPLGKVLIDRQYLAAISEAMIDAKLEELKEQKRQLRREWEGSRR
jgi:hypothetical protein